MGAKKKELGALAVSQITRRGINFVGGVAGLGINVTQSGSRSWILRYQVGGKRKDMGLGGYPDVTLAQAKEFARTARAQIAQGIDPINATRAAKRKMIADQLSTITFRQAATQYIDTHEASWRNDKHVQQWRNTIETYAKRQLNRNTVRWLMLPNLRVGYGMNCGSRMKRSTKSHEVSSESITWKSFLHPKI